MRKNHFQAEGGVPGPMKTQTKGSRIGRGLEVEKRNQNGMTHFKKKRGIDSFERPFGKPRGNNRNRARRGQGLRWQTGSGQREPLEIGEANGKGRKEKKKKGRFKGWEGGGVERCIVEGDERDRRKKSAAPEGRRFPEERGGGEISREEASRKSGGTAVSHQKQNVVKRERGTECIVI